MVRLKKHIKASRLTRPEIKLRYKAEKLSSGRVSGRLNHVIRASNLSEIIPHKAKKATR